MSALSPFLLDRSVTDKFLSLDLKDDPRIQAEYIWIGGSGEDIRSKTRTLDALPSKVEEYPEWNYDGSSTGQAPGHNSEVIMIARAVFKDPFRGGNNVLVMTDTYDNRGKALPTNTRAPAVKIFDQAKDEKPWFGIEQEYTIFGFDGHPYGWPKGGFPAPQGPYYCGVGADRAFGRDLVEAHYKACLYAGVKISGINAEVMPGQWEYQVGPCEGVSIGDHMWISRYIMHRVAEMFGVVVSFHPKPIQGDWNGAGCHTNFSTQAMRDEGGMKAIITAVEKLGKKHKEHIDVYGKHNELRLTGKHETAPISSFRYGVADRGASIRIPTQAEKDGKGYFEDRRPASNIDPYVVASKIVDTVCLWDGK
eukprot:TRINITY_DN13021_c0_g1_i2.p1 TRINITY_DN13021_c0_g1~~TRINITY_DN13021_c0_g1_i2.p1  ORF type:complete len:364 (+),score=88.19 TRINITY_DN13021_c0_g1_i2:111-1202(+)